MGPAEKVEQEMIAVIMRLLLAHIIMQPEETADMEEPEAMEETAEMALLQAMVEALVQAVSEDLAAVRLILKGQVLFIPLVLDIAVLIRRLATDLLVIPAQ